MKTGDIYYINFPFEIASTRELHPEILAKTAVSRINTPSIIYIGAEDDIDLHLNNIKKNANYTKLTETGIEFFLFEWLRYYYTDSLKYNRGYYNEVEFKQSEHLKLRSTLLDKLEKFSLENSIPININSCEAGISKYFSTAYPHLHLRCFDIQNQIETLGLSLLGKKVLPKEEINYKFWCATNRFTIHRHLLMCYLADKSGKYSWAFDVKKLPKNISYLKNLPWDILENGNTILNDNNLFIDQQKDKIIVNSPEEGATANYIIDSNASGGENFQSSLFDCFVCIVNETSFFQPTSFITEKTLNPMFSLTPFVLAAPPFTLEYIRNLGFKTFGQWWDESYDTETDHEKRILKLFKTIDYIESLSIEELNSIYHEMIPTLLWNQNAVLNFYKTDKILP